MLVTILCLTVCSLKALKMKIHKRTILHASNGCETMLLMLEAESIGGCMSRRWKEG
jgi:hypothetical protein